MAIMVCPTLCSNGNSMLRFCVSLLLVVFSVTVCDDQVLQRQWTNPSGTRSFQATLVGVDGDKISLQKPDGNVIATKANKFSKEDQAFVSAIRQCEQNKSQFETVGYHAERMVTTPTAIADIVGQLHENSNDGSAAGLYAGTLNAVSGDPERLKIAEKQLRTASDRLEHLRKSLPDDWHKLTLATVFNNRAIVAIRNESFPGAVNFLIKAAELHTDSIPFAVYHNATILNEVDSQNQNVLKKEDKQKLNKILAMKKPDNPGAEVPRRYLYSLAHNEFDSLFNPNADPTEIAQKPAVPDQNDLLSKLVRLDLWPELTCIACSGTGRVRCPKCRNGKISEQRQVQVGTNPINKAPIFAPRTFQVDCPNCRGRGGASCPVSQCDNGRLPLR